MPAYAEKRKAEESFDGIHRGLWAIAVGFRNIASISPFDFAQGCIIQRLNYFFPDNGCFSGSVIGYCLDLGIYRRSLVTWLRFALINVSELHCEKEITPESLLSLRIQFPGDGELQKLCQPRPRVIERNASSSHQESTESSRAKGRRCNKRVGVLFTLRKLWIRRRTE